MGQTASQTVLLATGVEAQNDKNYTMEEVAKHNTRGDCWIVVEGVIYDATSYAESHPGGPKWINEVDAKSRSSVARERARGRR